MASHPVPHTGSSSNTPSKPDHGKTADQMDQEREQQVAYQYLCHLQEAKNWISACIQEELPSTTDLEESLRNGVYLAKLAHYFAPEVVSRKRIFDSDFRKFHETGLHFRHTDNINYFLQALKFIGLPEIFTPETTDVYDRKNMPRVIFCIHALSLFLFKLGIAPQIQDLYGKVTFTDEEISNMRSALEAYGLPMPQFRKIGGILANEMPIDEAALHAAIIAINEALDHDSWETTYQTLQNPAANLSSVDGDNAQKYHIVLKTHKKEKCEIAQDRSISDSYVPDAYDEMLSQSEIQGHLAKVNMLMVLEKVEEALVTNDSKELLNALRSRSLNLKSEVKASKIGIYMAKLQEALELTTKDGFLKTNEIEVIIATANKINETEEAMVKAVAVVNHSIDSSNPMLTFEALINPVLKLNNINKYTALMYHSELKYIKEASETNIRYEGIVSVCAFLNKIGHINEILEFDLGIEKMWYVLNQVDTNVEDLFFEHKKIYYSTLRDRLRDKRKQISSVEIPLLLHSEIQATIDDVNNMKVTSNLQQLTEDTITGFQAKARGYLARTKLFSMLEHYYDNEDRVVKVQAIWRGIMARRRLRHLLEEKAKNQPKFKSLSVYSRHMKQILRIQRAWRQYKKRCEFEVMMQNSNMTLPVVRKYLHLLDLHNDDFEQELVLQELKGEITKVIRLNKQLEKDINLMDIKIGLLVKNRISIQDVVAHSRSMSKNTKPVQRKNTFNYDVLRSEGSSTLNKVGLKALKKESRAKLEAYQNLFYLLQTNPTYLAKLVFLMPQMRTTKFLESVILTLYNFGSNQREEFLLLKLFKTSLEEEIHCKVDKLNDIISGHPLVVKMIVSFYKSGRGQTALKEILGPLINRVLEDKTLQINTNPMEIYKKWVNQLETESGRISGMPYDVDVDTALGHEEVRKRLQRSITKLKQISTLFLTTILKSKNKIPYGFLYMSKIMYSALMAKFPLIPEKEILKVIGNLIYYRYINSAIVAPDSCDIIDIKSKDQALNNEQRKNLGSIGKVLQFAASKKGFGEESAHLMCLNQYIVESHEKFKAFFKDCCHVPEPEQEFSMDQYYEVTLLAKPVIYISLSEICDTHQLLLDYRYQLAANEKDPLHDILDDLDGRPSLCSLLGVADLSDSDASLAQMGQTEICLTLTSKIDDPGSSSHFDLDNLFVKTKQLIAIVLPCTRESNLLGCLKSMPSPDQIEMYWQLAERKDEVDKMAENNRSMLKHTNLFKDDEGTLPLEDCKRQILKNLQVLERNGYLSKKDDFKGIIGALGQDIINHRQYRTRRRKEIFSLKNTLQTLRMKTEFYEDQVKSYDQYLKKCLANLQGVNNANSKRVRFSKVLGLSSSNQRLQQELGIHQKLLSKQSIRYSGAKLFEKGILLTIEGLPSNQFRNVQFEFVPSEDDGIFEVSARFMGVKVEHVEVDVQELLQLQYDGVSVINMFGKIKINVNLLLHFLNSKFYGRRCGG